MSAELPTSAAEPGRSRRRVAAVLACTAVAALVVHALSTAPPSLRWDDFSILSGSLTWADTRANLLVPMNEHCWPVFRLATWVVTSLAGGAAALPLTCALATRVGLLVTIGLVHVFVGQERGLPFFGLAAAVGFGVTAVYQGAVDWYAASPAVWAAAFTLLALLSAQSWVRRPTPATLAGTALWSALAAGWYGGGVLTGPLCAVYLALGGGGGRPECRWPGRRPTSRSRREWPVIASSTQSTMGVGPPRTYSARPPGG